MIMKSLEKLFKIYANDTSTIDSIYSSCNDVLEYVNFIPHMGLTINMLQARYEDDQQSFIEGVQRLDKTRREKHETLIGSVQYLNALCRENAILPVMLGNDEDRNEVQEFAKKFCDECYYDGKFWDKDLEGMLKAINYKQFDIHNLKVGPHYLENEQIL